MTAPHVFSTRAVELLDDVIGEIRGYVFIWGDDAHRDAYGTYFDRARPPELSLTGNLVGRDICYEHGQDELVSKTAIGTITKAWFDDTGLAFIGQLDRSNPYFNRFVGEVRAQELGTSSSSAEHMAEFYEDGAFRFWRLTELSLTKNPAEERMPTVALVRSDTPPVPTDPRTEDAMTDPILEQPIQRDATSMLQEMIDAGYSLEEIQAALAAMMSGGGEQTEMSLPGEARSLIPQLRAALESRITVQRSEQRITTMQQQITDLQTALTAQQNAAPPEQTERFVRGGNHISVSEPRKYWHLKDHDLMFAHRIMRSQRIQPSEEFLTILGGRAQIGIEKDAAEYRDRAIRSAMKSTRANEVAISTASGGGDEWVAIAWDTTIWDVARNNIIFQELVSKGMITVEVPQGHESVYITTEGADPTVYTIAQDADLASGRPDVNVGATRIGTGRVLITPGELGMAVVWSDVFDEDSIVNVAGQYNRQMQTKAEETVEQLFINGDTQTSTTNINYDDGTPGTGLAVPYYIASNGAIKYALVTGSGTSRDGGALDENDYRETVKLMPSAIRTRRQNLAFIIDPDTHSASLNIAAVKTDDVRRTNATITSGVLENIWGIDVMESGFMLLAASDGKVTYNAAGTLGRLLCVYAPYWAMGTKRAITIETDRDILSGTNIVVAKMRIGFMPRGAGASTISYNLTV